MAWQLIYTSAPRSLEAGRSGFGTVARHRAITPLLAAAIERASQFSRQPGADADRVIYSYRIIAIGGGRFHVLSSIRDAGADYTGRTNHLAHHLVADPREIAQIGATGPSPADVLLGMPWTTSWNEQPRYLEASDEIPLGSFGPMVHGTAWQQVAGRASQAWLLASGEASRGAYVIRPASVDLREIFGESLRLNPERLWQISFTTSLQPSDEPADFRWIGIEEHSPLRVQTETSGRPIFNLAEPSTLPVVEAPVPAPAPGPVGMSSYASAMPSPATAPAESRLPGNPSPAPDAPASRPPFQPPAEADYPSRESRSPGGRTLWIAGGVACVVILILLAVTVLNVMLPAVKESRSEKETRATIETAIHETNYFTGTREIPNLHGQLEPLHRADLDHLKKLTELTEQMLGAMRAADFARMHQAEQDYTKARHDGSTPGLLVFAQFDELAQALRAANQLQAELSDFKIPGEDYTAFGRLQEKARTVESTLGRNYVPDGVRLKARLDQLANKKLAEALHLLLQGATKPAQNASWFGSALETIKPGPDEDETGKVLENVKQTVADWKFVEAQTPNKATTALETRYRNQSKDALWPMWLRGMAESKLFTARPPETPGQAPRVPLPDGHLKSVPGETGAPASLALYFLTDDRNFSVDLPARGPGASYFLHVEGKSDEELKPFANDISKGLGPFGESFKIQNGKLNPGAKPPAAPYAFVGKTEGVEAFRIYVGAGREDRPIFGGADGGLKREGDELILDLTKIPGSISQPLFLRLPPGFGAKGSKIAIVDVQAPRCNISKPVQELKEQVDKFSAIPGLPDGAASTAEDNAIRVEVRKLGEKPKKADKKPGGIKGGIATDEAPVDAGVSRPAEMLAALFDKRWDAQTGVKPNPADEIRAELAKKPGQADWGALVVKLKGDYNFVRGQMDGKSQFDKQLDWLAQVDRLTDKVCTLEAQRQLAQKTAALNQTHAGKMAEEAKVLGAHPLLHGQIPSGVYTLLVGDGDRKLPLVDFKIP